eukprot:jgi/Galph1/2362/GphlegSOOS_G29.1
MDEPWLQTGFPKRKEVHKQSFNLRELQKAIVSRILQLSPADENGISVGEKEQEDSRVTLHMLLNGDRQQIPEVPAVYFVAPTEENIERICQDLEAKLYESYYLNFTSSISRSFLEKVAERSVRANVVPQVAKVYDLYTSFIALENDLFDLKITDCYYTLHQPEVSNTTAEQAIDAIVSGLFSVLVTIGMVPVIQAQKGGPAEMVACKLESLLRDHLTARSNLFVGRRGGLGSNFKRPLLILMDRDIELHVLFHHSWTYQALMHDCLHLHLNRVTTYDMDPTDEFLSQNAGVPFPQVAENVEKALESYKQEINEINLKTGSVGEDLLRDDSEAQALLNVLLQLKVSNELAAAITRIPALTRKKRQIDMHTNIASSLLDCIKERALDVYFQLEDALMSKPSAAQEQRNAVINLLKDSKGSKEDRVRLVNEADLENMGCETSALDYVQQLKKLNNVTTASLSNLKRMSSGSNSAAPFHFETIMSRVVEQGYKGLTQVADSLKKLIPSNKAFLVSRLVDSLMENNKTDNDMPSFLYIDPKLPKGRASEIPKIPNGFHDAIVFVVGGGNYIEYQNLKDHLKQERSILYGTTDMVSPDYFLNELTRLGSSKSQ